MGGGAPPQGVIVGIVQYQIIPPGFYDNVVINWSDATARMRNYEGMAGGHPPAWQQDWKMSRRRLPRDTADVNHCPQGK